MESRLPYGFKYLGIIDEQFAVFPDRFVPARVPRGNVGLQFRYDPGQRRMLCKAECRYAHEGEEFFVYIAITCLFELDEASWSARIDEAAQEVEIGRDIHRHFGSFTVGTLRGYMHARLLPTPIRVLLPPVDVTKLVDNLDTRISIVDKQEER